MMNTFKLNVVNSLVVAGLVAASMMMPLVAAELAQVPTSPQSAPITTQTADTHAVQ